MQEISYIIALIGTLVLLASGAAWWNVRRQPQLQPIAGRLARNSGEQIAAIALLAAFALSLAAAMLAMYAVMF